MSIYTKNELTDSITANENTESKVWATRVYQGNKLTLILKLPTNERIKTKLNINRVNFGFKKFGTEYFGRPGASAACNINVLCPKGNGWQNERNSVALIIANGVEDATGSLIMNTCGTNTPYFLTANHSLAAGNVPNWVFQFQYWSATCPLPNTGWREDIQFNGCTLMASSAPTDFALLQLNRTPSPTSGIFYSGWSRSAAAPNGSVSLHHAEGDLMKFSRDFDASTTSSWGGTNTHWFDIFEQGIVQPGSSGAPLYDLNHRIVGQLHGDQANRCSPTDNTCFCTHTRIGEYGRFDLSWTGGGTNATRLSNWLDARNSGAAATNTTNIANLINAKPALSISGNSTLCSSPSSPSTYTLNGATVGTISWTSSNTSIATVTQGNPATVTPVGNGAVNITATVTICPGVTTSVTKQILVGVPNNYYIQRMSMVSTNWLDIYPSFSGYQLSVTSWNVYVDGSFSTSGSGYPPSVISVYASSGSHSITLTIYNSCGSYSTSSSYSGYGHYAITPNPANGNVTITDKAANSKSALTGGKVTITVFDNTNRPLKQFSFSPDSHYNFSMAGLTPGIYTLQIKQNGFVSSLKLIKQ